MPIAICIPNKDLGSVSEYYKSDKVKIDCYNCPQIHTDLVVKFFEKDPLKKIFANLFGFIPDRYARVLVKNKDLLYSISGMKKLLLNFDSILEDSMFPIILTSNDDSFYKYDTPDSVKTKKEYVIGGDSNILTKKDVLCLFEDMLKSFERAKEMNTAVLLIGD